MKEPELDGPGGLAEHGRLEELAVDLPWLALGAPALVALTRFFSNAQPFPSLNQEKKGEGVGENSSWDYIRLDPGAILLLARFQGQKSLSQTTPISQIAKEAGVLESVLSLLEGSHRGRVDWNQPGPLAVYRHSIRYANLAHILAQRLPGCNPDLAWTAGLLAPLGWLALSAIDPSRVHEMVQPLFTNSSQARLDHTAIARRLARRWQLPIWLAALVGNLSLPADIAKRLGADPTLFQIVQLAIILTQQADPGLGLIVGTDPEELRVQLGFTLEEIQEAQGLCRKSMIPEPPESVTAAQHSLLLDMIRLALDYRSRLEPGLLENLYRELEQLQHALEEQCAGEKDRLHQMKLSALAEFAGGASHEINNPLAVISGQAQYVLKHLQTPEKSGLEESALAALENFKEKLAGSLHAIVHQAQRIHKVLTDLMQFARPSSPQLQWIDVSVLMRDVADSLQELARERSIRLICDFPQENWGILGDQAQLRIALGNLLRNAVEAAPPEGWAGIRVRNQGAEIGGIDLVVEDNGPGPTPLIQEHLFDPFYSGRSAGRGRGLGLPTAWRLARQNNGNVHFEGNAQNLTRFILRLPTAALRLNPSGESLANTFPPGDTLPEEGLPPGSNGQHLMATFLP